jgi:lysozyme family protein
MSTMTVDGIIDGILQREGPGISISRDPADRGGRTRYGISERAHPETWRLGPPHLEDARAIYIREYVTPFIPLLVAGIDERIRAALIDDAVLSGVETAIRTLQHVVGTTEDGMLGPVTIAAARTVWPPQRLLIALVQRRAHRLARIVEQDHSQAKWIVGWIDRCLSFLSDGNTAAMTISASAEP